MKEIAYKIITRSPLVLPRKFINSVQVQADDTYTVDGEMAYIAHAIFGFQYGLERHLASDENVITYYELGE